MTWARSDEKDFQEYDLFRIDPSAVQVSTGSALFLWFAGLGLAVGARHSRRRSTQSRVGFWLGAGALLPLALAGPAPADPQPLSPRDCGHSGCAFLGTFGQDQISYVDAAVSAGESYQYFVRVVTGCGSYADSPMAPIEVPLPTPTPTLAPTPTRTFTPIPPTATFTPLPPTATATFTNTPTPLVVSVTIDSKELDNNPHQIAEVNRDDRIYVTNITGIVTFNTQPGCTHPAAPFQVSAAGLALGIYNDPELVPICYATDHSCADPMSNRPHAGLYLKRGTERIFVGDDDTFSYTVTAAGTLSLAVNDCTAGNPAPNDKEFRVQVTIVPAR